jgi:hypothetical protein
MKCLRVDRARGANQHPGRPRLPSGKRSGFHPRPGGPARKRPRGLSHRRQERQLPFRAAGADPDRPQRGDALRHVQHDHGRRRELQPHARAGPGRGLPRGDPGPADAAGGGDRPARTRRRARVGPLPPRSVVGSRRPATRVLAKVWPRLSVLLRGSQNEPAKFDRLSRRCAPVRSARCRRLIATPN